MCSNVCFIEEKEQQIHSEIRNGQIVLKCGSSGPGIVTNNCNMWTTHRVVKLFLFKFKDWMTSIWISGDDL